MYPSMHLGGVCVGRGCVWTGGIVDREGCVDGTYISRWPLMRSVRILLEYILVCKMFLCVVFSLILPKVSNLWFFCLGSTS